MISATKIGSSFHFVSLLLLLILLFEPIFTTAADAAVTASTTSSSVKASIRRPLLNTNQGKVDCSRIASRSECIINSRCKWCRSESIDDMCFSKSEAWRLPLQVFTCD